MFATSTPELLDRLPPQNLDAERSVLGSILIDPPIMDEIAGRLQVESFYVHANGLLWQAMVAMHDSRRPIDAITLAAELKQAGNWEAIGGTAYLAEVVQSVAVTSHAAYYANLVRQAADLRQIIRASTESLRDAYGASAEPTAIIDRLEAALGDIQTGEFDGDPVPASKAAMEMTEEIEAIFAKRRSAGVLTGIVSFDSECGGLFNGELAILAARPSQGKTALGLQIAYHVAQTRGAVYFASLEMSRVDLLKRLACSVAGVNSRKIRAARLDADDMRLLAEASNEVSRAALWFHDHPGLTVYELRRAARRLRRSEGLSLIVVDYLQLLTPSDPRAPREQQVAGISRALKAIARELDVPLLCLCQLNRAAIQEEEPQLHHVRESGAIEQDADMVMFLARGVSWQKEDKARGVAADDPDPTKAKLWLRKNRQGELGTYKLRWVPERTRFEDPDAPGLASFEV